MLPHQLTLDAAAALKASGVPIEFHIAPGLGHGIDQTGLSLAARFLVQAFNLQVPQ